MLRLLKEEPLRETTLYAWEWAEGWSPVCVYLKCVCLYVYMRDSIPCIRMSLVYCAGKHGHACYSSMSDLVFFKGKHGAFKS